MKTLFILLSLIIQVITTFAQGALNGRILDDSKTPLTGANIRLKEINATQTSDLSGKFYFNKLKQGNYLLEVSFIGFETKQVSVFINDQATTEINVTLNSGAIQLADIMVTSSTERPINTLSQVDIKLRPVNTSQDVLRMVPGLFIAQHAGGGKAEQIFLRGFDCDHGTDIAIDVDGLPVNIVSHAHGQGYADLHFLIPEIINSVDFDRGPYFASKGDFNTAGYVSFQTKNKLERNFAKLEAGSFYTGRMAAGLNILATAKSSAYIVSEIFKSDGFFDNNQNFNRFNLQTKYNTQLTDNTTLTASFSAFSSKWNASGQIPDRALDEGLISRFGSIDPTEGGNTSRFNTYLKLIKNFVNGSTWENQVFAIHYNFNLFSNFTFYLYDPVNGDQINQKDNRWVYGYKTKYQIAGSLFGKQLKTEIGAGARNDAVNDIALDHSIKRTFLNHVKYGDINELNLNSYVSETFFITDRLSINAALRLDYLNFSYLDKITNMQSENVSKAILNPKLNFNYEFNQRVSFFVRSGTGFHSNDARGVVARNGNEILPRAYGIDVGTNVKVTPQFLLHAALWQLDLDQEFVYSGDEGVAEPSGKTTRQGFDLSARYQLNSWLFADVDVNITKPRAVGVPEGESYIPLAPVKTSIAGLSVRKATGFNGSLRYRYMSDRPANEDNTIVAKGYFITDAIFNYTQPKWEVGMSIENVFDRSWKEAQFNTESRLKNETESVEEIHFTPGTPFLLRLKFIKYF